MLRNGLTSGAYAAALTYCAVKGVLTGDKQDEVKLELPGGTVAAVMVKCDELIQGKAAAFSAVKDSGDDPDVTNGCTIRVRAERNYSGEVGEKVFHSPYDNGIILDGGIGIGRVTLPGLEQEIGYAAINKVPREMIFKAANEAVGEYGENIEKMRIIIEIPEGEKLAEKTFNSKLGIEGGLSILGRTGILRPMSSDALIEAMRIEIAQRFEWNKDCVYVAPGNIGTEYLKKYLSIAEKEVVTCSNYVGESLDIISDTGFKKVVFAGDIGKLCKVAIGIFNTHSKVADGRGESFEYFYMKCGGDSAVVEEIAGCINTEQMIEILMREDKLEKVMNMMVEAVAVKMYERMRRKAAVRVYIFSSKYGLLGKSEVGDWND